MSRWAEFGFPNHILEKSLAVVLRGLYAASYERYAMREWNDSSDVYLPYYLRDFDSSYNIQKTIDERISQNCSKYLNHTIGSTTETWTMQSMADALGEDLIEIAPFQPLFDYKWAMQRYRMINMLKVPKNVYYDLEDDNGHIFHRGYGEGSSANESLENMIEYFNNRYVDLYRMRMSMINWYNDDRNYYESETLMLTGNWKIKRYFDAYYQRGYILKKQKKIRLNLYKLYEGAILRNVSTANIYLNNPSYIYETDSNGILFKNVDFDKTIPFDMNTYGMKIDIVDGYPNIDLEYNLRNISDIFTFYDPITV